MNEFKQKLITLKKRWNDFRLNPDNQKIRIRDAANRLDVSEAELLSTEIDNISTFYLDVKDIQLFMDSLLALDEIMLLIRNDYVVHEKIVRVKDIAIESNLIYFKNETKDVLLETDLRSIKHIFFEKKMHAGRELRSFQFFNGHGNSILKVYLKGKLKDCFDRIAYKYKVDYNYELQKPADLKVLVVKRNINFQFLDKESSFNQQEKKIENNILRDVFTKASKGNIPIQIHGVGLNFIQYHRGNIKNIIDYGPWINVIDKKFNIHILEGKLTDSILFKYSQNNRTYYSVEFFDSNKNHLMGVCSLIEHALDFKNILNELEVL